MHMLASEAVNPVMPNMTLLSIFIALAITAISLLITWLIIYSAVRAALTSHRKAMADDAAFARQMAEQHRV